MSESGERDKEAAEWLGMNRSHFEECHRRWAARMNRSEEERDLNDACNNPRQCGSCAYYVPLTGVFESDWGACSNAVSPRDGRVMFEHDGCEHHRECGWQRGAVEPTDDFKKGQGLTEVFRRGVLVPSSQEAAKRLAQGWMRSASDVARWVALSDNVFNVWWPHGVFRELGAACGTVLDNYEESVIPQPKVGQAASTITKFLVRFDSEAGEAARAVIDLCKEAERKSLPLIWIL